MTRTLALSSFVLAAAIAAVPAQAATTINLQPYVNSNVSTYNGGSAYPRTSTTIGGIDFALASFNGGTGVIQLDSLRSVTIAASAAAVDTAYVIINSAFGQTGRTSGTLTFNGTAAGTPISLVQGVNIRDHFQGSGNNAATTFATASYNGGARFDVYRYDISALGGVLNSIDFSCVGACNRDAGLPFLAGVTLTREAVTAAVPEPATWAMMLVGFGGIGFAMRRRKSKVITTVAYA